MPGKDTEVDTKLAIEKEVYKVPSSSNKTKYFSYKGEWANAL